MKDRVQSKLYNTVYWNFTRLIRVELSIVAPDLWLQNSADVGIYHQTRAVPA
ncbi:MAG: hypothetical protein LBD59_05670 [Prevotellaceae bacterium]|jgi:hypothetical protein|nr:hypothetical protein [Prevotellaceae bacterium]